MTPASIPSTLARLGWDAAWAEELARVCDPSLIPGRVSRVDRGVSTVLTEAGRVRVDAVAGLALAVGDWVTLAVAPAWPAPPAPAWPAAPTAPAGVRPRLVGILPRRTAFRRVGDDPRATEQVVAANIDTVFLVDALDGRLTDRHLERYVALAWQSGAAPVVVITKADLATREEVERHAGRAAAVAAGVAVHVVSAATGAGLDPLAPYLGPGRTVALLGLSGAGKSSLVNRLAGATVLATAAVRGDGKGRHTTTYRELVAIPGGGMLIDTPGMRALSVSAATEGVAQVFADLEALALGCGYQDCSHTTEQSCAVTAAVVTGEVTAERLAGWQRFVGETPPETPQVARNRVAERKRQKRAAKVGRAQSRASARKPGSPPPR